MGKRGLALAGAIWASSVLWTAPQAASPQTKPPVAEPSAAKSATDYRPVIDRYCVGCHNERTKAGGLTLDKLDLSNVAAGAEAWEKVVRKVRVGMMPPPGMRRPDGAALSQFAISLETKVDSAAAIHPNPGRRPFQRLNRAEYAHSVRDLLDASIARSTPTPSATS